MAEARHARKRATPAAAARNREAAANRPMTPARRASQENRQAREEAKYARAQQRERDERRARVRKAAGAPGRAAVTVTQRDSRYSAKHMLTAELLIGVLIVALRAVADYEPQADGTMKGKIGHPKGQYGPLPILAGLIITFFLLSFLAAAGGVKAKVAVVAGGIVDLALLMKSTAELETVTDTFGDFGKAKTPPGAWVTSGTAFGEPVSGTLPSGSGGGGNIPPSPKGTPPPPPGSIFPVPKGGCPAGYIEAQSIGPGGKPEGPTYCSPIFT